jgi:subtilisin family serine protease
MSVALAVTATALLAQSALAGNPFATSTSTAGGNETWDSDQINTENVSQTGAGVYVAVLDTGLVPNWKDYFPDARIAQELGTGFYQGVSFKSSDDPCNVDPVIERNLRQVSFIGSRSSSHGTHTTSTIIGYNYDSNSDTAGGFSLPPIQVRGIAPNATIIPVKVLADYQIPSLPKCDDPSVATGLINFGTDSMVSAGIDYVTSLAQGKLAGKRIVINMSLGDSVPSAQIRSAIDRAIDAGVVVVASAGNEGEDGMGWPGAYPEVISAAASGWTGEWLDPTDPTPDPGFVRYRMFWLQDTHGNLTPPLKPGSGNVAENGAADAYITDFSSREKAGQDLDVAAPGSWVRGPFPGTPGYNHLPWWSKGVGDVKGGHNSGNFFYVGGTSMAAPHVTATAALMLQKNPRLIQSQIESILESTAAPMGAGSAQVWDPFHVDADGNADPSFVTFSWGTDATGAGLLQADDALAATP